MAAVLRGALVCTGDVELLFAIQRIFPGPPRAAIRSHGARSVAMSDDLVKILDGNTFVVSDDRGDIEASLTDPTGLFSFDTRFLSKWVLTVNGERLTALSTDDLQYFETRFFLVPGYRDRLRRREAVGDPPTCGGQRLPRGAVDPQSRRRAGRSHRPGRRRLRLRRPVRGQGRAAEEGLVLQARRRRQAPARVPTRHVLTGDRDLVVATVRARRERADVRDHDRAARDVEDRPRRRHRAARDEARTATVRRSRGR